MSFEITPMRNRVLPIALGAAVAVVSLGAIAIPAANAQPMIVVRPAHHHHHHHRGGWNVPPAAATMALIVLQVLTVLALFWFKGGQLF